MGWNPFKKSVDNAAQNAANEAAVAAQNAATRAALAAPISIAQTPDSEVEDIKRRMMDVFNDPRKGRGGANLLGARPFDDTAYSRATLG